MTKRLRERLEAAIAQKAQLERQASGDGGFAYEIAARSMIGHIEDLTQQLVVENDKPIIELLDLRLKAPTFRDGSAPLHLVSRAATHVRQMVGYAALRLTSGGLSKKRVPTHLYAQLDLRLAGLLPGSSRLVVTASSDRDLLDDGMAKGALERLFRVLQSKGHGHEFLEAVTDVGPQACRQLRELIDVIRGESADAEFTWRYGGEVVRRWEGTRSRLDEVSFALAVTEVNTQDEVVLEGVIELLSKRERIHLRVDAGDTVRILFPKRLLSTVAELHLDQCVRLQCSVTQTENPYTGESSTFHELLKVLK